MRPRELPVAHLVAEPLARPVPALTQQAGPQPRDARREKQEPASLQHPLTAEHRALYRDSELLDACWRALQAHDFPRAREMLEKQRSESARAYDDLNDGLTILADCIQHPSAEARAHAQRFYDDQTYSMARRRIRRYCLEPNP